MIYVPAADTGAWLVLEVRDSGHGMDAATLARIFEPFFTTQEVGGGMGLAMVHGIVHGHHGHLVVTCTPGRGAIFCLLFPPHHQE